MSADENPMLAASSRGLPMIEMPEWKKNIMGGSKASFGKKEKKSIIEQRQSLPIFKLKDVLIKVGCSFLDHAIFICCHEMPAWFNS